MRVQTHCLQNCSFTLIECLATLNPRPVDPFVNASVTSPLLFLYSLDITQRNHLLIRQPKEARA